MTDSADPPAAMPAPEPADLAWLRGVAAVLRQRWWLILGCGLLLLIVAVIYLRGAEYSYSAALRVAPAPSAAAARENSSLGALGNLAALTGVSFGAVPATPFRLYVEGLRSRTAAICLARDPAMLRGVFADEWRADVQQWKQPQATGTALHRWLNHLAAAPDPGWSAPGAARLQRELATLVSIEQSGKSAVTLISVDARDPAFGVRLLQRLHLCVDDMLRQRALTRARQNIVYLQARLGGVVIAEHRQILIATLADQQQRLTILRNPAAYAAEPFGAVTVSPGPTKPRPLPIVVAALVLGFGLGAALALLVPRRQRP